MAVGVATSEAMPPISHPRRASVRSWPLLDRAAYALCWVTGIGLSLITAGIVLFMLLKGVSYPVSYTHLTLPTNREV